MSDCVYEKGGSKKYILTANYVDLLKVKPKHTILTDYCELDIGGELWISKGFEWDGASGPAIDTDTFMDGSLVHDVLYRLIREGHLKRWPYRLYADNEMFRQCKKDKMILLRRIYIWLAVRIGGYFCARG